MDNFEKVEKIREKAGVTYEEARAALEAANGDILDALVRLENEGKIKKPETQYYSTDRQESGKEFSQVKQVYEQQKKGEKESGFKKFFRWCKKMIKKGCENSFVVEKDGKDPFTVPVLVLVLLLLFAFWLTVSLLIVGLFCGYKYSFRGDITKSVNVNAACEKASQACESIKAEFNKGDEETRD